MHILHVHHVHYVHRICTKLCQYIVLANKNTPTNFQSHKSKIGQNLPACTFCTCTTCTTCIGFARNFVSLLSSLRTTIIHIFSLNGASVIKLQKFARVHIRAQITCTKVHRICTKLCQQIVLIEDNNQTNFQRQRSFRYQITKIKRNSLMTS